jgi:3-deoxy-7-phosphoheptulonate synthase
MSSSVNGKDIPHLPEEWSPSSWRQKTAKQQPVYADELKHKKALEKLETLPPLVTASEVQNSLTPNTDPSPP